MLAAALRWFRAGRMRRFAATFPIDSTTRILDIGGTPEIWSLLPITPRITLLNMPRTREDFPPGIRWVAGDGRQLPFLDNAFDIVFSNSVIEHVGDETAQRQFAAEAARVGRSYWVQTPNRFFPVEHHLLTPLVHFLPRSWQRAIVPRFTVWSAVSRPSPDRREFYLRHYLEEIRLLSYRDMQRMFPGARIVRERFLGFTKALVAVGRAMR